MSDNTLLPERRYLEMHVPISELCLARSATSEAYRLVFRLQMLNISRLNLRILGRKWTMRDSADHTYIIEADHVFNQDPMLTPGAVFSFGGHHDFKSPPVSMELRLFGVDQMLLPFITTPYVFPNHCFRLSRH